jgi:hypothetical protein
MGLLPLIACSEFQELHDFGVIAVSDPTVGPDGIRVKVKNNSEMPLCYFEDAVFYGPGVIEGASGQTQIADPGGDLVKLSELEIEHTGSVARIVVEIPPGSGTISFPIATSDIQSGDDLSFSLFGCVPERDDLHRTYYYIARLK